MLIREIIEFSILTQVKLILILPLSPTSLTRARGDEIENLLLIPY